MCGISGGIGVERSGLLEDMSACQRHRGPDSVGTFVDADVQLGNQRLSVIDVASGDQPIFNEDGDVVVVYNGEIYNFPALRAELDRAGHVFTTETDTEVLVHGYEEWGTGLFERLNGMFALALYDATAERVLLARDRVGVKPLYVAPVDGGVLFASEPKSILYSGLVESAVDDSAVAYFLQMRYSPSKTSLFAGIDAVEPGTYVDLRRSDDGWTKSRHRFWDLTMTPSEPPANPKRAIRDALRSAVERQLVSDVPVGFYLSGGLDTSSIVAMASDLSDDPIHTFCMGFEDGRWDERDDARAVADAFDTIHHEISIEESFMEDFPRLIWHADEPKRNLYPYYVAEEMAEHVTVALGGLGADELFGGYVYRFNRLEELEALRQVKPQSTSEWLRTVGQSAVNTQLRSDDWANDGTVEDASVLAHLHDPAQLYVLLNSSDVLGDATFYRHRLFGDRLSETRDPADVIRELDVALGEHGLRELARRWDFRVKLPDDFLLVEDRMSMAHSLESRVPFLDNELLDLAFSIPVSTQFDRTASGPTAGKRLLRRAMRDTLPETVFQKDKQGFTMPTYPFVRDHLFDHARCILDDPWIVRDGYVESSYLEKLMGQQPRSELTPHYKLLWKLVGLEIWYQIYVLGDGIDEPRSIENYYT